MQTITKILHEPQPCWTFCHPLPQSESFQFHEDPFHIIFLDLTTTLPLCLPACPEVIMISAPTLAALVPFYFNRPTISMLIKLQVANPPLAAQSKNQHQVERNVLRCLASFDSNRFSYWTWRFRCSLADKSVSVRMNLQMLENRFQSETTDNETCQADPGCVSVVGRMLAVWGCSNVAPHVALTHLAFASFSASRHHCFLAGFLCIQTSSLQPCSSFMVPPTLLLRRYSTDQGYSTQSTAFLVADWGTTFSQLLLSTVYKTGCTSWLSA